MKTALKQHYGNAEGPLGFPVTDKQAFALEDILKNQPKDDAFSYRKLATQKATSEVLEGERSDVSWISTENPDLVREVVIAKGMKDGPFQLNPLVTMNHSYWLPPVGRSLWRKRSKVKEGVSGIKAKTQYTQKPDNWPSGDWPPDVAFSLVQSGLLNGKSIGFMPTKVHAPTEEEIKKFGWKDVRLVIDEWILLEYACCYIPCQGDAVVESVSKSLSEAALKALELELPVKGDPPEEAKEKFIPFTPLEEIGRALERGLLSIDFQKIAQEQLDKRRGRV